MHEHPALLADAIRAVRRLALDGGVPPAIEVDHVAGAREVETGTTGFQRQNEEGRAVLPLKLLDETHALLDLRFAGEHEARSSKDACEKVCQRTRHLAELGEDQRLLLPGRNLVGELGETRELSALLGCI